MQMFSSFYIHFGYNKSKLLTLYELLNVCVQRLKKTYNEAGFTDLFYRPFSDYWERVINI